jgi:glycosyltransferase involved in cell wall biosynthesis
MYRYLGRRGAAQVPRNVNVITEEKMWFLRNVDNFLNIPNIYDISAVAEHLPSAPPIDLSGVKNYGYDTVFTTSPWYIGARNRKLKIVQTLHDLIPMNVIMHREQPGIFYKRLKAGAERADGILAVSEHSRREFLDLFPFAQDRIKVVYQPLPADERTVRLSAQAPIQESVLAKYGLERDGYLFYVGAIEHRKNIHRMIAAHQLLPDAGSSCPLVLAGPIDKEYLQHHKIKLDHLEEGYQAKNSKRKKPKASTGPKGGAKYIGYVSELEKLCLLRCARAFMFPTLSEGFGIPLLEAQAMGCPVLTAHVASVPEVVADSAAMVQDPYNIEEIADVLTRVVHDDAYNAALRQAGLANALRFDNQTFARNIGEFLRTIA